MKRLIQLVAVVFSLLFVISVHADDDISVKEPTVIADEASNDSKKEDSDKKEVEEEEEEEPDCD